MTNPLPDQIKVLVLEDVPEEAELVIETLRAGGLNFTHEFTCSREKYLALLETHPPDLILADYYMPDFGAVEALEILREKKADIPLIVVTGSTSEEIVVETMKKGASDYVLKTNLTRLVPAVRRSLETAKASRTAREALKNKEDQLIKAQKMEVVGRLAGGVAHDFNNILAAISGYSEFLLQEIPESHPARSDVIEIRRTVERAATLTRQLLAFSRKQIFQLRELDLNALISESKKILGGLLGETVRLRLDLRKDLWRIKADSGQIEQVIFNLVINSRDAMPAGGTLAITTRNLVRDEPELSRYFNAKPGDYVFLSVTDTGTGMSREVMQHLFEPFFTTKEKGTGTGIGLSTAYGIITQSGGNIRVESEQGKGTKMCLIVPRMETETAADTAQKTGSLSGKGETVMLLEDNDALRPILHRALALAGYNALIAKNAAEAFNLAGANPDIDLLVTDIVLPDMNGYETAKILRKSSAKLKVIFMSGYTDDATIRKELMEKTDVFIPKPFAPSALLAKIREVLGGK